MRIERCDRCRWWDAGSAVESSHGRCRKALPLRADPDPKVTYVQPMGFAMWLWTEAQDWCGEWAEKDSA
jgi:hypothetical protein